MKKGIINIFDRIGLFGISSKQILSILNNFKKEGITRLELRINSPGGSLFEGFSIFNQLRDYATSEGNEVHAIVDGVAASIASVIALSGSKISVYKNSYLFIHNPWSIAIGDTNTMKDASDDLAKFRDTLIDLYKSKTGMSEDELKEFCNRETFLSADECLSYGFIDDIIDNYPVKKFVVDSDRVFGLYRVAFNSSIFDEDDNSINNLELLSQSDLQNVSAALTVLQNSINNFSDFISLSDDQIELLNRNNFVTALDIDVKAVSELLNQKVSAGEISPALQNNILEFVQFLNTVNLSNFSDVTKNICLEFFTKILDSIPSLNLFDVQAVKPIEDDNSIENTDDEFLEMSVDETQMSLHKKALSFSKEHNVSYTDAILHLTRK